MVFFFSFWFRKEAHGFLGFVIWGIRRKTVAFCRGGVASCDLMPSEPLPWDRKDFYKDRKHEKTESQPQQPSTSRWRESPSMSSYQHRSFREFTCWGSADFRRPPGKFFPSLYTRLFNTVSYINLYLWLGLYHHELCWMGFSFFGWGVRLVRSVGFIGFDLISFGDI